MHNMKTADSAPCQPWKSRKVAVVGAGVAGLAAARELMREGHAVTVFEQKSRVGGLWVYDPDSELDDPLGVHPARRRVHSSIYASLHTNLPREIMGYTDFPFLPSHRDGRDGRRFPGHAEVAAYLHDFATFHGLLDVVRFDTVVEDVRFRKRGDQIVWTVRSRPANGSGVPHATNAGVNGVGATEVGVNGTGVNEARMHESGGNGVIVDGAELAGGNGASEEFDAVVVCNGHYSEPKLADVADLYKWPKMHMHSHNYRDQNSFINKGIRIVEDISRDIAEVAKEVHLSGRTWNNWSSWSSTNMDFSKPKGPYNNIWLHSAIEHVCEDGSLKFKSGESISADIILQVQGFHTISHFYIHKGKSMWTTIVWDPLYEHIFPPSLAPSLAFVGIPFTVAHLFRMCELQSRWIAMALSRKIELPSPQEMMDSVQKFYAELKASGKAKHLTHQIASTQYDYDKRLVDQTGSAPIEDWRIKMEGSYTGSRLENHEICREEWVPDELILKEAYASLKKMQLRLESP